MFIAHFLPLAEQSRLRKLLNMELTGSGASPVPSLRDERAMQLASIEYPRAERPETTESYNSPLPSTRRQIPFRPATPSGPAATLPTTCLG
jgi:hypothetical protein